MFLFVSRFSASNVLIQFLENLAKFKGPNSVFFLTMIGGIVKTGDFTTVANQLIVTHPISDIFTITINW